MSRVDASIVLLGTDGAATAAVVRVLGRQRIAALVVPGPGPALRRRSAARRTLLGGAGAVALAQAAGIAVVEVPRPGAAEPWPETIPQPDILLAACYPWRVPRAWRAAARRDALNVHPSLLPAYRGPAPMFWQMRDAEARTGVTVHRMDDGLDTGDTVFAIGCALDPGESSMAAEARLFGLAAERLGAALDSGRWAAAPQPGAGASRQGSPGDEDRTMGRDWTLARALSFVRALDRWGPFLVRGAGAPVTVREAVSATPAERLGVPVRAEADGVTAVALSDGVLRVR